MSVPFHDIVATVSDLHLADGGTMEDFHRDEEFVGLVRHLLSDNPQATHIRLQLLGDIFDPLAIAIDGVYDVPPFEGTCMRQMEMIINAHPEFFDVLKEFLLDPRTEILLFIGNHDFFVEWDGVQAQLWERISGGRNPRLRFVYEELYRGVYYTHGNFEPNNAIDMTERYLLPATNTRTREPLLNYPYGSYLTSQTMPRLRELHPFVGRLVYHGYLYKEAATRNLKSGLLAAWMYIATFVRNSLFAFWDVRRKTSFWMTLKIIGWTIFGTSQEIEAEKIIAKRPRVWTVVCGHDHDARDVPVRGGRFLNTGTWSLQYDIVWKDEPNAPFRFRLLTRVAGWISHIFHTPEFVKVERLPVVVARHGELRAGEQTVDIKLVHWNYAARRLEEWNFVRKD